ncbi:hypothetical protein, partial [Mycobacterium tuberculosis]|uniref:hypothetical protein n=1 Tax=Mycobacterium tuberculosis TaxID=1773 RepID=UPI00254F96D9
PSLVAPIFWLMHYVDHESFEIHECAPGAARNVGKLLTRNQSARPVQIWDQEYRCIEVQSLRQGG